MFNNAFLLSGTCMTVGLIEDVMFLARDTLQMIHNQSDEMMEVSLDEMS